MNLRKEHAVFAASLLAVAGLVATSGGETRRATTRRSGQAKELELPHRIDLAHSLPHDRALGELGRDFFSQPRDVRPLPPLMLQTPPEAALSALRPPPDPGPRPRLFGRTLRAKVGATPVPELFTAADVGAVEVPEDEEGALKELTAATGGKQAATGSELALAIEGWKQLYDWIRISEGRPLFGYIRNEDRYGLRQNASESILFVEVDPATGREKFPGQAPIKFERQRVLEFALANTFENEIQLRRREFGKQLGPGQQAAALALADECVRRRGEARRALEVAEELYTRVAGISKEDPAAELGLARCYEAQFELDKAFAIYEGLLAKGFAHRPEVHARLAEIEARLRLFDSAEQHLLEAEKRGRGEWSVQWSFGKFLSERGRWDEALERLRAAYKLEPGTELKEARTGIRVDLGRALLATGALAEARDLFQKALQSDPQSSPARAGLAAVALLDPKLAAPSASSARERLAFEELLNRGLASFQAGDAASAVADLELAAETDPLRASLAWRALSWIAEVTGHTDEAFAFVERAWRADPTDPWILYQRGRLSAQRDDFEGAREAFQRALDQELDFADALIALGALYHHRGEHPAAERYYARALELDDTRSEVHSLRGWNALEAGDVKGAEESFQKALRIAADDPVARLGLAWCAYRRGDLDPAQQLFAEVIDARRASGENDPFVVYAQQELERITDHATKAIWSDHFERRSLRMGWLTEESAGPTVTLVDGRLVLQGKFDSNGSTRAFREWLPSEFYAVDMDVRVDPGAKARIGVFISKERATRAGSGVQTLGKVAVARHPEGGLQVLTQDAAEAEETWVDVPPVGGVPWWPTDRPVHVRIERVGEGSDATGRISIDGITVLEGFRMRALAATSQTVRVGVFAEGATGRPVKLFVDDVEVIHRLPEKR